MKGAECSDCGGQNCYPETETKRSFFEMEGDVPKLQLGKKKKKRVVPGIQKVLNLDGQNRAIYAQFGWLDAVGYFSEPGTGVRAEFQSFTTDTVVRAFDHSFSHARLELALEKA